MRGAKVRTRIGSAEGNGTAEEAVVDEAMKEALGYKVGEYAVAEEATK